MLSQILQVYYLKIFQITFHFSDPFFSPNDQL